MAMTHKKKTRIISLLHEGYAPQEIASRAPCSISYAYHVRDRESLGSMKNRLSRIEEGLEEIHRLLRELAGVPDIIERRLNQ